MSVVGRPKFVITGVPGLTTWPMLYMHASRSADLPYLVRLEVTCDNM
jgi:hypothetical protein